MRESYYIMRNALKWMCFLLIMTIYTHNLNLLICICIKHTYIVTHILICTVFWVPQKESEFSSWRTGLDCRYGKNVEMLDKANKLDSSAITLRVPQRPLSHTCGLGEAWAGWSAKFFLPPEFSQTEQDERKWSCHSRCHPVRREPERASKVGFPCVFVYKSSPFAKNPEEGAVRTPTASHDPGCHIQYNHFPDAF